MVKTIQVSDINWKEMSLLKIELEGDFNDVVTMLLLTYEKHRIQFGNGIVVDDRLRK